MLCSNASVSYPVWKETLSRVMWKVSRDALPRKAGIVYIHRTFSIFYIRFSRIKSLCSGFRCQTALFLTKMQCDLLGWRSHWWLLRFQVWIKGQNVVGREEHYLCSITSDSPCYKNKHTNKQKPNKTCFC